MTSSQSGPWWRRPLAVLAALAMTGGAVVVTAPAASAAPASPEVTAGSLDWGVKETFRKYLAMPFAKGSTVLADGATQNGDGTFNFPAIGIDLDAQVLSFAGSVDFSAHDGALAVKIGDIRLDLGRGMLVADVVSKAMEGDSMVTYDDVDLTTVAAGAIAADGNVSGTALPTVLTAAGSPAFASNYAAGDAFDPVTFALSYVVPVVAPVISESPATQSVESGAQVTFTAAATGHDSVQWQVLAAGTDAWADIAGATGPALTIAAAAADTGNQYRAAFTNAGGVVYSESAVLTVALPETPEVPEVPEVPETPAPVFSPELAVFAADGVTPLAGPVAEGTKVVVKGSGFDPAANVAPEGSRPPIAAGNPAGVYVVFGKFADTWRPSENAPSSARVVGDQLWAMSQAALDAVPAAYKGTILGQWVEITPEGGFTAELTVQKKVASGAEVQWPEAGNFGVYTYAAGGTKNAAQELYAPIAVGDPVAKPVLTVKPADGLKHNSQVKVSGTGYAPKRWIYVAEVGQGPGGENRPEFYENAVRVRTDSYGSFGPVDFSVTTIFKNGGLNAVDNKLFISTFNSPLNMDNAEVDRSADRTQDAFVELGWADASAPVVPEPEPEPEVPAIKPALVLGANSVEAGRSITLKGVAFIPGSTLAFDADGSALDVTAPASTAVTGGLDWGVKESFRKYLGSSIANGTVETNGGATVNPDGTFHFPAASYDSAAKMAGYAGGVSMVGHDDALQVNLSNIRVDVKGKKLLVDVSSKSLEGSVKDYAGVALASLDTANVAGNELGLAGKNLAAVLTADGVPAFADFYAAGETLDAVSFDIQGAAAELPLTIADDGTFSAVWTVPSTQQVGSYKVTVTATAPDGVEQDRAIAAQAVVQSASAQLEITAPVVVPETDGPTTPVETERPADKLDAGDKCTNGKVVAGTLNWGVKESFRKYITGNIAKGSITFNETAASSAKTVGAGTVFTFNNGTGTIDADKRTGEVVFDGTVSFQGHDYGSGSVLSVTMKNVTLVMDGNIGTLKADVVSRSLESATVGAKPGADTMYNSVVLATLDLSKSALNAAETVYSGTAVPATLAASGVAPFADFYAAGEALDSLAFNLGCTEGAELVGSNGDTSNTAGAGAGALAKTGAMGLDASVIGALLVLLLGSGVIVSNRLVRRRRY